MEVDPMFQQRVNNALVQMANNPYIHGEVQHAFTIMPNFYFLKIVLHNGQYLIRALCFDDHYEATLFLDANAFRLLVLNPMTEGIENAMKDYHSIGHGW